ncbi:response regulator transcription factor [Limibacter armeniacum]|uniref:response regulator transcription factor n=1 Tax=Limibacter armeniacum TaxID=466084 RepID=UPI002FE5F591
MKILLVEDNLTLAEDLLVFVKENGFMAEHVESLTDAKERTALYTYDLVIVDIGLPDGSGLDLVTILKQKDPNTGILIVSAKDSIEDKVNGLEIGADDYITKPFHTAELNARIRSILRRKKFEGSNIIAINELRIDVMASQVWVGDKTLDLTKKEYDLLLYFVYNRDRMLTKESIAEHLWGDHIDQADNFDFIYNHIKNLRKKIVKAGGQDYIRSVYGVGYKFSSKS